MWAAVLIVVALTVLYLAFGRSKPNYPPGPRGLPWLGQVLAMSPHRPERYYMKLHKEYGKIFAVKVGPVRSVILADADLIREAFGMTAAAGRQSHPLLTRFYADTGLVFSSGEVWQQTRRFTLFHLRNFGMGKSKLEAAIADQVTAFMNEILGKNEGQPVTIDATLDIAVVNILWNLISSQTLDINDSSVLTTIEKTQEVNEKGGLLFVLLAMFPFLLRLPDSINGMNRITPGFWIPVNNLLQPAIDEHRRTFDPSSEPRDYIDCFLQEQQKNPAVFTDRNMVRSMIDLFFAGSDTTSNTLRWAFCFLCTYPEVQRRVQTEIDEVVGGSRRPELADRPSMPYTDAFLMETQRCGNLAPIGVPHVATEDFQLAGYTVPRGTQVIALLAAVHSDPRHFPEPEKFRPERFLDTDGRVKPNKSLMPFSTGKRSCLGEAMARSELFLFITSVLQSFNIRFPDGFRHDFSVIENKFLVRAPVSYQLIATKRR